MYVHPGDYDVALNTASSSCSLGFSDCLVSAEYEHLIEHAYNQEPAFFDRTPITRTLIPLSGERPYCPWEVCSLCGMGVDIRPCVVCQDRVCSGCVHGSYQGICSQLERHINIRKERMIADTAAAMDLSVIFHKDQEIAEAFHIDMQMRVAKANALCFQRQLDNSKEEGSQLNQLVQKARQEIMKKLPVAAPKVPIKDVVRPPVEVVTPKAFMSPQSEYQ